MSFWTENWYVCAGFGSDRQQHWYIAQPWTARYLDASGHWGSPACAKAFTTITEATAFAVSCFGEDYSI
jgi:hypothetical protein